MNQPVGSIEAIARQELEEEDFREAVAKAKERIIRKRSRSLWSIVFPWIITIKRRD